MTALALRLLGLAGALILAAWLYWLTAKVLLLLTYAEQLLGTSARLLAAVPGQSAPRTDAADEKPRNWFARLRALADLRQPAGLISGAKTGHAPTDERVDGDELARWADDGGHTPADDQPDLEDETPTDVFPAYDPPTSPTGHAIDVWQHTHIPARTEPDDEPWRTRFDFSGGRRHRPTHTATGGHN